MSGTATAAPDQIGYLDFAASVAAGMAGNYKRRLLEALDVRAGQTVVDVGCGPGIDLRTLAVPGASVIGVDRDPAMLAEAGRRMPGADLRLGDAHALPLADGSADRVRTDRVVQHLAEPAAFLREGFRVLRPGGLLGMAEPDWDTLTVAADDVETSRGFARFTAGQVRNSTIGRQLPRLAARAGFEVRSVEALPVVFRDFEVADQILGLTRNSARAVEAAQLRDDVAAAWLSELADPRNEFLAAFTCYLVVAGRPN
jgi:ubiquinone/menaquinone biosynthesis C-methylase UbiE